MLFAQPSGSTVHHVEIKAYLDSYDALSDRVALLSGSPPVDRVQNDIFFHCRSGRLKLRSSGQYHDLIYYRRKDDYGPTESFYQSARIENPAALQTSLNSAFGELGRVKKFRRTYKVGESTVHLDRVGGLGDFLEIKTELNPAKVCRRGDGYHGNCHVGKKAVESLTTEQGSHMVASLMSTLDVDLFQLVDGAYIDLINEKKSVSSVQYA